MALVDCPECGHQVSTAAVTNELLAEVRPSWWNYFWHLFFFFLIIPPLVAWGRRRSFILRVYPGRVMLERGLLSKSNREFDARDIRSIEIDQSFWGRIIGVGNLTISTSATVDPDEEIEGIPDPKRIRNLIIAQREGR